MKKVKTPKQIWNAKWDKVWSLIIHKRDKVCQRCFSTNRLNAHHIFSRSGQGLRHDTRNGILLCGGHHKFLAHQHPIEFHEFLKTWFVPGKYTEMLIQSKLICKNKDYKAWEVLLTNELKEYGVKEE